MLGDLPGRMRPIGAKDVKMSIGTNNVSEKNGVFRFTSKSTTNFIMNFWLENIKTDIDQVPERFSTAHGPMLTENP